MGVALFTLAAFFTPLLALFGGFAPREPARGPHLPCAPRATGPARPLRVLRVVEPQAPASCAGRMVISGRMADVCAELDRLAALEASRDQAVAPAR